MFKQTHYFGCYPVSHLNWTCIREMSVVTYRLSALLIVLISEILLYTDSPFHSDLLCLFFMEDITVGLPGKAVLVTFHLWQVLTHVWRVLAGWRPTSQCLSHGPGIMSLVATAQTHVLHTNLFQLPCEVLDVSARAQPGIQVTGKRLFSWNTLWVTTEQCMSLLW